MSLTGFVLPVTFSLHTETEIETVVYMQEGYSEETVTHTFNSLHVLRFLSEGFSALSF